MRRAACLLTLAGSMFWLTALGVVEPSAPAFARQVKAAPVLRMKAAPVDEPDMLVLQFGPQFKQLHKSELHFMRIICQPTKEQFAKIEADTEPALKETIKKFVPLIQRPVANDDHPDPRKPIAREQLPSRLEKSYLQTSRRATKRNSTNGRRQTSE